MYRTFVSLVMTACIFAFTSLAALDVTIPFSDDSRSWELVREEEVQGQGIMEYMPKGQTAKDWKEVVTVQYFSSDQIQPKQLFELFMTDISKQVGDGNLKKQVFQDTDTNVLASWTLTGTGHDQTELVRIFSNQGTIAIVRYTTRATEPNSSQLTLWKTILEKVQVN